MRIAPLLSAGLFLSGLLVGSAADVPDTRAPMFDRGYRILAADFHVHAFPGDGALTPSDLLREARRRRLDVIALTNHNQMLAARFAAPWSPAGDVMLLAGQEVTASRFHLAAVGLTHPVDWRGSIQEVAAAVHEQGGVAIGAHPAGPDAVAFDAAAAAALDGLEVAHPMMELTERFRQDLAGVYARAAQVKPTIAPIGSSDYHFFGSMGLCRTYLFVREVTPGAVLDAVRSGRTVACDQQGNVTGHPDLSRSVIADCRTNADARLQSPAAETLSLALTWFGLLGLVLTGSLLFRRPETRH